MAHRILEVIRAAMSAAPKLTWKDRAGNLVIFFRLAVHHLLQECPAKYCSENPFQKQFNTCSGRGCWDQV